jgi:hypothetical protein
MKTTLEILGGFPALRGLNAQQFVNAIEPRLIDIRNPLSGLQVDMFGRVNAVDLSRFSEDADGTITVEIEVADAFLESHGLTPPQLAAVLAERITKLRHPATGAMSRVEAMPIRK